MELDTAANSPVGVEVGVVAGTVVGMVVGVTLGTPVGVVLGTPVGVVAGTTVGTVEGTAVGVVVGSLFTAFGTCRRREKETISCPCTYLHMGYQWSTYVHTYLLHWKRSVHSLGDSSEVVQVHRISSVCFF